MKNVLIHTRLRAYPRTAQAHRHGAPRGTRGKNRCLFLWADTALISLAAMLSSRTPLVSLILHRHTTSMHASLSDIFGDCSRSRSGRWRPCGRGRERLQSFVVRLSSFGSDDERAHSIAAGILMGRRSRERMGWKQGEKSREGNMRKRGGERGGEDSM